ncbi:MAG: hypothetical protein K5652_01710 [Bacteroidales bacterium]|nr:hypothetical protein [Bacteroidales bacterium]
MKKTKLVFQENQILTEREAGTIRGGAEERSCYCACYYRYVGGSTIVDNANANFYFGDHGISSKHHTKDGILIIQKEDGQKDWW